MDSNHPLILAALYVGRFALCANIVLGLFIFWTNKSRLVNQFFLVLTLTISIWQIGIESAFVATEEAAAVFWIRQCHVMGLFVFTAFDLLRMAIVHRYERWSHLVKQCKGWILASLGMSVLLQTPWVIEKAVCSESAIIPEPVFGPGMALYVCYFIIYFGWIVRNYIQDTHRLKGAQRIELQFTLLGCALGLLFGVMTVMVVPMATGKFHAVVFAPLWVLILDGIIAYGVATHRIMDVASVLRRATAYSLLALYLTVLYFVVWKVTDQTLHYVMLTPEPLPHLAATLATAFSVAPVHGHMQHFALNLFITFKGVDISETLRSSSQSLQSITTVPELLNRFSQIISRSMGTDRVMVLLPEEDLFVEKSAGPQLEMFPMALPRQDPIIRDIEGRSSHPLVLEELERHHPGPEVRALMTRMTVLNTPVIVGIRLRNKLKGLLLLGPRLSGRVYAKAEQEALQILCDQFAVALENAELYTNVQNSKIYDEILLDSLVSGVIAVTQEGKVKVYNREAQRILNLPSESVLNQDIQSLPAEWRALLQEALAGHKYRDKQITFSSGRQEQCIRVGTSTFTSHSGKNMGALLVFNDITSLKQLESQVRRNDRLASVGTLSAGLAHEIKNPLVAIKTFSQLLPERYEDPEFRESFSTLVVSEIERIDAIVGQLLTSSRESNASFGEVGARALIEKPLKVMQHLFQNNRVVLECRWDAGRDLIRGQGPILEQVFTNFFLNAVEAMEGGGKLQVSTSVVGRNGISMDAASSSDADAFLKIEVRDTGKGISSEDLPHIFDPFFTTKSTGTGLGLSVAHKIIKDHGGEVSVRSERGVGTTFTLLLPLLEEVAA